MQVLQITANKPSEKQAQIKEKKSPLQSLLVVSFVHNLLQLKLALFYSFLFMLCDVNELCSESASEKD